MTRATWNSIVDGLAYFGLATLATTGLMLRYQLPPGSGGSHGMGSGAGSDIHPVTVVWGLSRHEWGDLHYWIALALMAVLAAHLLLHWKWIFSTIGGKPHPDVSGARFMFGCFGLMFLTLLAAAPLLAPTEIKTRLELQRSIGESELLDSGSAQEPTELQHNSDIQGFMTFEEVAQRSGVSVAEILQRLHLPADTAPTQQVGRLLRSHGMQLSDLRQAIGLDSAE